MFNVNVDIKLKETHYPIRFNSNLCVKCGKENTLEMVDIFGKPCKSELHPFDHIRCNCCGAIYSILWEKDDDGHMAPYPTDPSIKQEIFNLLNKRSIDGNKINTIKGN